jgi:transposase-like protein
MTTPTRSTKGQPRASVTGIGQRPPFRWTCPSCQSSVTTLVTVTAAPTCSAHTGGGRQMIAERVRFRDLNRSEPNIESQNERR